MSTLLLRLAAPLQSWGVDAKFENRRSTERVPSKSGIIGLLAAALGRRRDQRVDDLQALRFGVRVDQEGVLLRDYHTAKSEKDSYVTQRYYLADALFLAGLEGEEAFLRQIHQALCAPAFPLFLGRRSCPPEGRVALGVRADKTLLQALREEPWLASNYIGKRKSTQIRLRLLSDAQAGEAGVYLQRDLPLSFDQRQRKFAFRPVLEHPPLEKMNPVGRYAAAENPTQHDPMEEL